MSATESKPSSLLEEFLKTSFEADMAKAEESKMKDSSNSLSSTEAQPVYLKELLKEAEDEISIHFWLKSVKSENGCEELIATFQTLEVEERKKWLQGVRKHVKVFSRDSKAFKVICALLHIVDNDERALLFNEVNC